MIESETRSGAALKAGGIGCAVAVLLPVVVVGGVVLTFSVERATPEGYPDVKPETMARRVTGYSKGAFAALGLDRTLEPNVYDMRRGDENTLDSDVCYPDGLESIADQPEEGAYRLYHRWSVGKVAPHEGANALRGLRAHLGSTGWRITESGDRAQRHERTLKAERDGGYTIALTWETDRGRLSGGTSAPCATNPGWKESDGRYAEPSVGRPPALIGRASK
ncbi:hypothetical protein ACGFOU_32110 [Streptomyces sp. NPDC048595]|uniref:hypothetical protein n=1 Tax=Streptomyces sp. NPDC048595 TaxID=3365576 RepID=UPI003720701F